MTGIKLEGQGARGGRTKFIQPDCRRLGTDTDLGLLAFGRDLDQQAIGIRGLEVGQLAQQRGVVLVEPVKGVRLAIEDHVVGRRIDPCGCCDGEQQGKKEKA